VGIKVGRESFNGDEMLAQPVSAAINAAKHHRRQGFKMGMVGLFIFVFPLLMLVFLKFFLGLLLALQTQSRFVLLRTKTLALLSLSRVD